jgi:nicotinate-nucleotide pyrophosphorylase (carboxylating)
MSAHSLDVETLVQLALREDLALGDLTTEGLWPKGAVSPNSRLFLNARQSLVLSGTVAAESVIRQFDPSLSLQWQAPARAFLEKGSTLAVLEGPYASILQVERTLLNFLQHLSGVATHTRRFVKAIAHTPCRVVHTRKTTPGFRFLEIQAVLDGGAWAHRPSLGSAAMLKDNHWRGVSDDIAGAIAKVQRRLSHTQTLTVEVDTLEQAEKAVAAGAKQLLLDNMSVDTLTEAVKRFKPQGVLLEASGGITLESIAAVAETGVHVISTSQLTLGAPAVDIGLDASD